WWKPASSGRCAVGFNNWEPILLYGRGAIRACCDVIRTVEQASLPVRHQKEGLAHPCPTPLEWATKQLSLLEETAGTVLDPLAGTGTVAVACKRADRDFVGIEINPGYHAVALKCLSHSAGPLFADLPLQQEFFPCVT